jgi:ribonuclease T1
VRTFWVILWVLASLVPHAGVQARESTDSDVVALSALPREAQETHRLIRDGGPFPYDKDGSVFGNREQMLPRERRGFYHEYTVATPGARNRGARRIICGGQAMKTPDICYYTQDHYASFRRIAP